MKADEFLEALFRSVSSHVGACKGPSISRGTAPLPAQATPAEVLTGRTLPCATWKPSVKAYTGTTLYQLDHQ
eukprot:3193183-Rhodomonas_salina.1